MTAAYVVCKDEHLAAIITKPDITAEEIAELPDSKNIMLRKRDAKNISEFKVFYLSEISGSLNNLSHVKGLEENNDFSKPVVFKF